MYGVRHHINDEFPEFNTIIERLKNTNQQFARLLEKYNAADKEIYGYEQRRQPVTDSYLEQLKKWRLQLKDQLYNMLRQNHHTYQSTH